MKVKESLGYYATNFTTCEVNSDTHIPNTTPSNSSSCSGFNNTSTSSVFSALEKQRDNKQVKATGALTSQSLMDVELGSVVSTSSSLRGTDYRSNNDIDNNNNNNNNNKKVHKNTMYQKDGDSDEEHKCNDNDTSKRETYSVQVRPLSVGSTISHNNYKYTNDNRSNNMNILRGEGDISMVDIATIAV